MTTIDIVERLRLPTGHISKWVRNQAAGEIVSLRAEVMMMRQEILRLRQEVAKKSRVPEELAAQASGALRLADTLNNVLNERDALRAKVSDLED